MSGFISIEILNKEIFLDRECWACDGGRRREDGICGRCNGRHYVLTEIGEAIMELVKRHFEK